MPLLLEVTIRSTALWLIAWLLLKLLRVRDAHAEKFVWTVVALASLAMPLLMRAVALPLPRSASVIVPAGAISARLLGGISHPELGSTLLSIYLIVSGLLLLRFLARLYRSFRLYHRARRPVEMVFANLNVRLSSDIRTPCTLGSTILLPVAFESWSPVARAAAIAHECAHVLHRDCYRMWLATLYQCAFWFSPFPWLLRRRLALLAE
ncbi:MAG TPA: M56 family metallopeptidase, partial [Steroidobacteraceae bacterium]